MLTDFISPQQLTAIILGLAVWYVIFVFSSKRSYSTGVGLDDLPLSLTMKPYRMIRIVGLVVLAGLSWMHPTTYSISPNVANEIVDKITNGDVMKGSVVAFGLHFLLMFAAPFMIARERQKRDEPPGEWLTPALVFYRWVWVGLLLLLALQLFPDIPGEVLGYPLNLGWGIGLPILAAVLYLLYWGMPSNATARRAADGDPQALDALSRVRWLGLPAFVGLLRRDKTQAPGGRKTSARKLCPSCMRPIDSIDLYHTLKFDACPQCHEMIPPVYTLEEYIRVLADRVLEIDSEKGKKGKGRNRTERQESELVQCMFRAALTMALRNRGTDVHITTEGDQCVFRCRTDGMLFTMLELPGELQRLFVSSLKARCNMDISERRKPQDGSLKTVVDDVKLDIRVNTSPTGGGETASLRLLYQNTVMGQLETLGMTPRALKITTSVIAHPHGLVLVTGPTGSGKSTTLYNALATIADGRRNIITLEDPVEYKLEGITQMQIDPRKNFDFATGLRTILRQDPDVIMVGEIRDAETAKMAVDAAMTGHLVFSTLHTIDTTTTIGRLQDLEVDPHRHADALVLLISQRLVRINCQHCSETLSLTAKELEALGLEGGPEMLETRRGKGCTNCNHTGYFGRNGIYEMLRPDDKLKEMIGSRTPPSQIRQEARKRGMRILLEDGLIKVALGRTTVEEVLRVTN